MGKSKRRKQKEAAAHHPYRKPSAPPPTKTTKSTPGKPSRKSPVASTNPASRGLPFNPSDRILLVGEGDFSFSNTLHTSYSCASLTATTLETKSSLLTKHPQSAAYISALECDGHTVLYSIDATRLGAPSVPNAARLRRSRFDTIIFNFPHVGGKSTDVNRQVRANQALVVGFLGTAKGLLADDGKVLLTIFEGMPYELWGVRNLARHVDLRVERSMRFDWGMWPGYQHARTLGNVEGGGGWKGEEREARMFVLVDKDAKAGNIIQGTDNKTIRGGEEDEDTDDENDG